jgi:uncharacterized lipoprotein
MPALLGATLLSLSLTACSFFQKRSQSRENVYQKSTEARPLEVPPGLDMPNSSAALVIPTPAAAPAGDTVAAGEAPATSISPAAGNEALPPGAPTTALGGVSLSGDGLKVADTPESTWSRVGLALIRSGAATIVSSDKQGLSYEIESTGVRTEKAGWFKRAITFGNADKEVATRVGLKVRIEADGDASRVRIEGDGGEASRDAAADILEALRRRLS